MKLSVHQNRRYTLPKPIGIEGSFDLIHEDTTYRMTMMNNTYRAQCKYSSYEVLSPSLIKCRVSFMDRNKTELLTKFQTKS